MQLGLESNTRFDLVSAVKSDQNWTVQLVGPIVFFNVLVKKIINERAEYIVCVCVWKFDLKKNVNINAI